MTKSDLIEVLCESQKLPKGRAESLVNTIFDSMERSLRRGERIEIRGFGSFEIRHYKPYGGRNPRTGQTVPVQAKRLPFFRVGKELKERVNRAAERAALAARKAPVAARSMRPLAAAPLPLTDTAPALAAVTQGLPGNRRADGSAGPHAAPRSPSEQADGDASLPATIPGDRATGLSLIHI